MGRRGTWLRRSHAAASAASALPRRESSVRHVSPSDRADTAVQAVGLVQVSPGGGIMRSAKKNGEMGGNDA